MARNKKRPVVACQRVELDGVRYVILREALFEQLCRKAGVEEAPDKSSAEPTPSTLELDHTSLTAKLIRRRQAAGLSQAELARRAAIRPETLNRIERGWTTPDFATIRKLVVAINAAEQKQTRLK
jgi:ribosome-binding protein aMBF1 (putative translation factor)